MQILVGKAFVLSPASCSVLCHASHCFVHLLVLSIFLCRSFKHVNLSCAELHFLEQDSKTSCVAHDLVFCVLLYCAHFVVCVCVVCVLGLWGTCKPFHFEGRRHDFTLIDPRLHWWGFRALWAIKSFDISQTSILSFESLIFLPFEPFRLIKR